jgi:hypothetical protein
MFENRELRRIFRSKRDEVLGGWRNLHNEELRNFYYSPNTIIIINLRRLRWVRHVVRMKQKPNAYTISVERPEGKGLLGTP